MVQIGVACTANEMPRSGISVELQVGVVFSISMRERCAWVFFLFFRFASFVFACALLCFVVYSSFAPPWSYLHCPNFIFAKLPSTLSAEETRWLCDPVIEPFLVNEVTFCGSGLPYTEWRVELSRQEITAEYDADRKKLCIQSTLMCLTVLSMLLMIICLALHAPRDEPLEQKEVGEGKVEVIT